MFWQRTVKQRQNGMRLSKITKRNVIIKLKPVYLYFMPLALASIVVVTTNILPVVKVIAALLLALCIPGLFLGYGLVPHQLWSGGRQIMVTLGIGFVLIILGALLLNVLPLGLVPIDWLVFLVVISTLAAGIALRRRSVPFISINISMALNHRQVAILGLAVALSATAFLVAERSASQQRIAFSQLWLLPSTQAADTYTFNVGVRNMELATTGFVLELTIGDTPVGRWKNITLENGQIWQQMISVNPTQFNSTVLEAKLYRISDGNTVYRHVWFQLRGTH